MSKFNNVLSKPVGRGPIASETTPSILNPHGVPAFLRDAKSELFLLAVSNFVDEQTFYESGRDRDSRFVTLVKVVAVEDFGWIARFAGWLRSDANMRTASLVLAAEAVKARVDQEMTGSRGIVNAVLQRPDEPGEFIAYWHSRYGRKLPQPVKRGVADAAVRLYTERSVLKWDGSSHGVRFADVIRLTHPTPKAEWQERLFHYVIGKRLGVDDLEIPAGLETLTRNASLRTLNPAQVVQLAEIGTLAPVLADAGATWEAIPSLVNGPWTKELWESIIPSMGYMALLRNLRNFDQAGVSDEVAATVAARLADPEQVAKSRQFPMRFLSAYNAAPSLRWAYPLEKALDAAVGNVPRLKGRTLIMVDTSYSMNDGFSKDGTLKRWDAATLFGLALARRCDHADVVSYSNHAARFPTVPAESLLTSLKRWRSDGYFFGGGTATAGATAAAFDNHDRVVILTDEQSSIYGDPGEVIPPTTPLFTYNLAGYQAGHTVSGPHRHAFGGLSDAAFRQIPLLENGADTDWPF